MAKGDKAKEILKKAKDGARKATAKGKEKLAAAGKRIGKANTALREMKGRRYVDAAEVVAGAALAGGARGMSLDYEITDGVRVGVGAPVGVVAIGAGVMTKSYDLQSLGLGMVSYEIGRLVEDAVVDMNAAAAP